MPYEVGFLLDALAADVAEVLRLLVALDILVTLQGTFGLIGLAADVAEEPCPHALGFLVALQGALARIGLPLAFPWGVNFQRQVQTVTCGIKEAERMVGISLVLLLVVSKG